MTKRHELNDLTVNILLNQKLGSITEAQIDAATRRLNEDPQEGEIVVGVIESPATRAMYTMCQLLVAESDLREAQGKAEVDEMLEKEHEEAAILMSTLASIAREIFWAQARLDLSVYESSNFNVGLRKGWVLTKMPRNNPGGMLAKLMIGGGS
jgi:hypothetical protein